MSMKLYAVAVQRQSRAADSPARKAAFRAHIGATLAVLFVSSLNNVQYEAVQYEHYIACNDCSKS